MAETGISEMTFEAALAELEQIVEILLLQHAQRALVAHVDQPHAHFRRQAPLAQTLEDVPAHHHRHLRGEPSDRPRLDPSAAIVRSAKELYQNIHYTPDKFKRVITLRITPEQTDEINKILFMCKLLTKPKIQKN